MVTKTDRWIKRWQVPSFSEDKEYTVALDKDGNYGCSCPAWKFRRQECHHIKLVKMGGGKPTTRPQRPRYVLAQVNKPTYKPDTFELLIPLVAIPDVMMMEATICFYMLKYGYSMREVREARHIPAQWTVAAIFAHIERHGEAEYPEGWYNSFGAPQKAAVPSRLAKLPEN